MGPIPPDFKSGKPYRFAKSNNEGERMKWLHAFSAAIRSLALAFNSPAPDQSEPTDAGYGHVTPIFQTRRTGGDELSRRDQLEAKIKAAIRGHRPRKRLFSEQRALTHTILGRGVK